MAWTVFRAMQAQDAPMTHAARVCFDAFLSPYLHPQLPTTSRDSHKVPPKAKRPPVTFMPQFSHAPLAALTEHHILAQLGLRKI